MDIESFVNHQVNKDRVDSLDFASLNNADNIHHFHQSLPNYVPTPLARLDRLANRLNVKEIRVKDESKRFDLNAFKGLGASYAIACYLSKQIALDFKPLNFKTIKQHHIEYKDIVFVTATDGNHGRAVAWAAQLFGCQSVVYMPRGSSENRLNAIKRFGADASITDYNYDDTVLHANEMASKNGWVLVQDTAWQGYENIPIQIMQGYFTLVSECINQDKRFWPTHIFLQAGVGSFAAAILAIYYQFNDRPKPKFIIVEPTEAPCLFEAMKQNGGEHFKIAGDMPTLMAGLACGEPSTIALNILREHADVFIKCDDEFTKVGMKLAANPIEGDPNIVSGESGAVGLGILNQILSTANYKDIKNDLELNQDSRVLLFSTEGDTDP
ncbi:MAG: diaminopropionate ammonia-lyase, partial [Kangiellaceae bacterium]